ncbi:MAG: hypothetical protein ACAF41_10860 [Leptolyngbya sp. BL-A-14]
MRKDLRRIESMLAQLAIQQQPESVESSSTATVLPQAIQSFPIIREPSIETHRQAETPFNDHQSVLPPLIAAAVAATSPSIAATVNPPRSPSVGTAKAPSLPGFIASTVTSEPLVSTSGSALEQLKAIEQVATGWQDELQQLLQQMEAIYTEGPIVAGWLEAYDSPKDAAQTIQPASNLSHPMVAPDSAVGSFRLCGVGDDGQLWFRHCPAEQVAAVKLAIDRHERLKHLLARKQQLDAHLGKLAEALVIIHEHLETPKKSGLLPDRNVK